MDPLERITCKKCKKLTLCNQCKHLHRLDVKGLTTMKTEVTDEMIKECKRDLPPVQVKLGKNVVWGRTTGRKNVKATVTVENTGKLHSGNVPWRDFKFSWEDVCYAVVSGVPLETHM